MSDFNQPEFKDRSMITYTSGVPQNAVIIEIRAATGGDEAELFSANLLRMYLRFSQTMGWKTEILSTNRTSLGGLREIIFEVSGPAVASFLQYEGGVHRVQRIPQTEKSGRIHTSTATVAVLPEPREIDLQIDPKDLRIEAFRASGHGGQSVNTADSAVRITHLPTRITVSCQDERSQLKNRQKALRILRSRIFQLKTTQELKERGETRRSQIGMGQRSEKIRTYNFPQDRLTDHRIGKSWHNLSEILEGKLEKVIATLKKQEARGRLKNL